MKSTLLLLLLLILGSFFSIGEITQAQSLVSAGPTITLVPSPSSPSPNAPVNITVDAYTIDTTGATIIWFIDGTEQVSARNNRSLSITTGELGKQTDVTVQLKLRTGQQVSKTLTINPSRIDLVIEADTLVPAFYRGRSLPSVGSTARVVAVPADGSNRPPTSYSYLWQLNNKVLFGGPLTGTNIAFIPTGLGNNQLLTVEVIDTVTGALVARKSIGLPLTKPEIHFYGENPLRGPNNIALNKEHILVGDEITVRAEPYYMSADIFSTQPLLEWEVNGSKIDNPSTDPQFITLRRQSGAGSATIGFHIRNLQQLIQGVEDTFTLRF